MDQIGIRIKGIVKHEDKYLVVKQWYDDRILDPYRWQFIDGQMEFGEDPAKAAIRLIKEQTGIDAFVDRTLYTWSFNMGDTFVVGICYECFALHTESIISEEIQDIAWITIEEFETYIDNKDMLNDLASSNFTGKGDIL